METDAQLLSHAVDCLTEVIERTESAKTEYRLRLALELIASVASGPYRVEWPNGNVETVGTRQELWSLLDAMGPAERWEVVVVSPWVLAGGTRSDEGGYVYELLSMEVNNPL